MPAALSIPSQNLVVATDTQPAQFRPSNQLRLEPSRAANPATHGGTSFAPGFLEYRSANYWGDMGLGYRKDRQRKRLQIPTNSATASNPSATYPMASPGTSQVASASAAPLSAPGMTPAGVGMMPQLTPVGWGGVAVGAVGILALFYLIARK